MDALISVIMPAYNAERWIAEGIENIRKQTYKNWELLIVNDGSTDQTLTICEEYSKLDIRIKVITQKNQGPGAARNTGLSNMKGDYFIMVDSDDLLPENALRLYKEAAEKYDADTVIGGYRMVNVKTGKEETFSFNREEMFVVEKNINTENMEQLILAGLMASNWNKLYKSSLKHLRFDEKLSLNEDVLYSLSAVLESEKTAVIPQTLYIYKIQNDSSVSLRFHPEFPEALDALNNKLLSGQKKPLRKGIAEWLMNYLHIYFRMVCISKELNGNKITYIKKGTKSQVFQNYGTVWRADTKGRKAAIILLKLHCYRIYIGIMRRKKGSRT